MAYKVIPLEFAQIDCDESILFQDGIKNKKRRISCFAWLLQNKDENILIDTGIEDITIANKTKRGTEYWERGKSGRSLTQHLVELGIANIKISKVLVTHAHYDHISGLSCLQNAEIYISHDEYLDFMSENNAFYDILKPTKDFALKQKEKGLLFLYKNQISVNKDIQLVKVGGHTKGSIVAYVNTLKGKCLFTGDAIFLLDNIFQNRPIGFTENKAQSVKIIDLCRNFQGLCLTGHDLQCLKHFRG